MRESLFDVNKFAICNRDGRCKRQKDGCEERKEEQRDACHDRKGHSECTEFTRSTSGVGGWGETSDDRKLA